MSFSDTFSDASKINSYYSAGYLLDSRGLVCQSRSNGGTFFVDDCENLNLYAKHVGGTAQITQLSGQQAGTNNPAGTNVYQFYTGSTLNSDCRLDRTLTSLAASYGVYWMPSAVGLSNHAEDALVLSVQNTADNKMMRLHLYLAGLFVEDSTGVLHLLSSHTSPSIFEIWVENKANGDGTNTVNLYEGTQRIATLQLTMPIGTVPGLVEMQQLCGVTANTESQVGGLHIGLTQLPDNAVIQSIGADALYNFDAVNALFLIEDICDDVVLGTDFRAEIAIGGGIEAGNWEPLDLVCVGSFLAGGIVDYTKTVWIYAARYPIGFTMPAEQPVAYKMHMLNGKMMACLDAYLQPVSIY